MFYNFNSTYTTPITPPPQPLLRASASIVVVTIVIAIAIVIVHPMVDCYINCLRIVTVVVCSNKCAFL